jgi:hypothetical protein
VLFRAASLRRLVEAGGLQVLRCTTSARDARWIDAASRTIRRDGHAPAGVPRVGAVERLRGFLFQLREQRDPEGGEELVLTARRG